MKTVRKSEVLECDGKIEVGGGERVDVELIRTVSDEL